MTETPYNNRKAVQIETAEIRITVLTEGGHIAEILNKETGVNPLWTPPWPSIEPSTYDEAKHPEYGQNAESGLLAGITGHNICLDIFGGPSDAEAAAGLDVHGEAATGAYTIEAAGDGLVASTELAEAGLRFTRRVQPTASGWVVRISETVENLRGADHPVGWTQHVTMGPPYLDNGRTQFRAPGTKSKVFETDFAGDRGPQ